MLAALVLAAFTIESTDAGAQTRSWPAPPKDRTRCDLRAAPALCRIHWWVRDTWSQEDVRSMPRTRYGYYPERHPGRVPWDARRLGWKARSATVRALAVHAYPGWFGQVMACISTREEYGEDGPNTSAGYFGLVYPPSGYIAPGPAIAASYGDSWLDVPLEAQVELSYALYRAYGFAPWSTHALCGV